MEKNVLLLPKKDKDGFPYVSYSQVSTWMKNRRDYIRQYFFNEPFEGNAYTDFGSLIGEALENNNFDEFDEFTTKEKEFLSTIPRYDEFEKEIRLELNGFYVKGYIDTSKKDFSILADYKTGDIEKKRADYDSDDYFQTEIYAAALEQQYGVLPEKAEVILIGRKGNAFQGEPLELSCEFEVITKPINRERIDEVVKTVQKVAEEISACYKVFLKLKDI